MKFLVAFVLAAIVVSVSADCGCLKCGKHLKIVSPPGAPVTVIERGEACICEKPIPYHIEIPHIVGKSYPTKSYGYRVQHIRYVKPQDPVLCHHGYHVEIPQVPVTAPHYYEGLVAKTDRVVMPARDECPPPKPTCDCGPVLEYFCPNEDGCRGPYRTIYCRRGKRELHNKNRTPHFYKKEVIRTQPKNTRPIHIRNPWETQTTNMRDAPTKISPLERFRVDLKGKIDALNHRKEQITFQREVAEDKPFRISIPLNPRKQFFLDKKNKAKYKSPPSHKEGYQGRIEINPIPTQETKPFRSKTFTRFIEKSGKFSTPEDVAIAFPISHITQSQKAKIAYPFKTRKTRSVTIEDETLPYYKITRASSKRSKQSGEDSGENSLECDGEIKLQHRFLKPFDVETMVPENQAYYLLNTPIRMLKHIHKMREHVGPMVQSVPNVLDTSANYFLNFGKRFRRGTLDFFKELFGNVKKFPARILRSFLKPSRREKRDLDTSGGNILEKKNLGDPPTEIIEGNSIKHHQHELSKRAIVKLVPDDDIREFLREKLSIFASSEEDNSDVNSEEDILLPVTPKSKKTKRGRQNHIRKNRGELVLEKLTPKLVLDKGDPYLDIDGHKKPLVHKKRKTSKPNFDRDNIQDTIGDIIEEARLMAANPSGFKREYEPNMSTHTIKAKISDILENIQDLIEQDFDRYETIYGELLNLQRLKESAVDEWKYILIKKKHNDYNSKINLLNKFNAILSLKDEVLELISEVLVDGRSFNTNSLVKKLIRLQKLQCTLVKIVENFAENIKFQTPADIPKQIKQVDFLATLDLVTEKTLSGISASLQEERDREIKRQVSLLDNLKNLLDAKLSTDKDVKMDEVAKILWEIGNCEKIQWDTLVEMKEKIRYRSRIRRELKIIFDLERQIEICQEKLEKLFSEISKRKDIGLSNSKTRNVIKVPDKLLKKKPLLKTKSLKKTLRL
ncbi:hypothetical protein Trydic_g9218 [Trypoxylus dichotomus]